MTLRQENPNDYSAVYDLVKSAFATAEHSNGNEQDLVVALRKSKAFIPELSLIAEIDGEIIGHILFTKIKIGDNIALALAPLAVFPKHQNRALVRL